MILNGMDTKRWTDKTKRSNIMDMSNTKYATERQAKEAKNKSIDKWQKANTTIINFRLNNEKDKSVIDKLKSVPNKADYIRQLILKDMKGE